MGRLGVIDAHAQRQEIIQDIINGIKPAQIAQKYAIHLHAVYRYIKAGSAAKEIALAQHKLKQQDEVMTTDKATEVIADIKNLTARVEKFLLAAERELESPINAGEIDLSPRSHEIMVIYLDFNDKDKKGNPRKKKKPLDEVLDEVQKSGRTPVFCYSKAEDSRKIAMATFDRMTALVKLLAQAQQVIVDQPQIFNRVGIVLLPGKKDEPINAAVYEDVGGKITQIGWNKE